MLFSRAGVVLRFQRESISHLSYFVSTPVDRCLLKTWKKVFCWAKLLMNLNKIFLSKNCVFRSGSKQIKSFHWSSTRSFLCRKIEDRQVLPGHAPLSPCRLRGNSRKPCQILSTMFVWKAVLSRNSPRSVLTALISHKKCAKHYRYERRSMVSVSNVQACVSMSLRLVMYLTSGILLR